MPELEDLDDVLERMEAQLNEARDLAKAAAEQHKQIMERLENANEELLRLRKQGHV